MTRLLLLLVWSVLAGCVGNSPPPTALEPDISVYEEDVFRPAPDRRDAGHGDDAAADDGTEQPDLSRTEDRTESDETDDPDVIETPDTHSDAPTDVENDHDPDESSPDGEASCTSGEWMDTACLSGTVAQTVCAGGEWLTVGARPCSGDWGMVFADYLQTCALTFEGQLYCFGNNAALAELAPSERYRSVATTGFEVCGLRHDNRVECWDSGGAIDTTSAAIVTLDAGSSHFCGLRAEDRGIECWGSNGDGQLNVPEGRFKQVSAGVFQTCALDEEGHAGCWGWQQPPVLDTPTEEVFEWVEAVRNVTCGLRPDGSIQCWGWLWEAPVNRPPGRFQSFVRGSWMLCGLSFGEITCFAERQDERDLYESVPSDGRFITVSAGYDHVCALTDEGDLTCWGAGRYGELDVPALD